MQEEWSCTTNLSPWFETYPCINVLHLGWVQDNVGLEVESSLVKLGKDGSPFWRVWECKVVYLLRKRSLWYAVDTIWVEVSREIEQISQ